jgi:hypothetical protein
LKELNALLPVTVLVLTLYIGPEFPTTVWVRPSGCITVWGAAKAGKATAIASNPMAIVRSHDDIADGETSFTVALDLPVVRAFSPTTTRHWRAWFQTMRWILFMEMNPHFWKNYYCVTHSQRRLFDLARNSGWN